MSHHEPHTSTNQSTLNWLRAAVLGSNDGIISLSSLLIGVASATDSRSIIVTAGVAGLLAGAFSMAAGEYVSVSTQRDSEKALLDKEKRELKEMPDAELLELIVIYERKGLKRQTAEIVANELTEHDAFAAHVDAELNIDPDNLTNAFHAATASAIAFVTGALIPFVAILLLPASMRIWGTFLSVVVALLITGVVSAKVSNTSPLRASIRVVVGGMFAMLVTYGVGTLFKVSGV